MSNDRLEQAVALLRVVETHLGNLAEAWQRGDISEHDGRGGERSNRNAELLHQVMGFLDAAPAPEPEPDAVTVQIEDLENLQAGIMCGRCIEGSPCGSHPNPYELIDSLVATAYRKQVQP